jgi:hypothetical protein
VWSSLLRVDIVRVLFESDAAVVAHAAAAVERTVIESSDGDARLSGLPVMYRHGVDGGVAHVNLGACDATSGTRAEGMTTVQVCVVVCC